MITGSVIAEIAALVGDPARAEMLSALLDGRPLAAGDLALAAGVTPQTASSHLAKLTQMGLLSVIQNGRHRYFRLASPTVVEMLEGIAAVALERRPRRRPLTSETQALDAARVCYDHLAGRLSIDLTDFFTKRRYIVADDKTAEITPAGARFLTEFGIDVPALGGRRRKPCRLCLDWTERRPHLAGTMGAALTERCFHLGWLERMKRSSAVVVTKPGKRGFMRTFGIDVSGRAQRSSRPGMSSR
ncbi:MAG TPA: helix-turn-helix transcriptional regulator [bacterium]